MILATVPKRALVQLPRINACESRIARTAGSHQADILNINNTAATANSAAPSSQNTPALRPMGRVTFVFPARPEWDQEVFIFTALNWQGEPVESAEIAPGWFEPARLPFRRMWSDAIYWIPPVLNGVSIDGRVTFADDCASVERVAGL